MVVVEGVLVFRKVWIYLTLSGKQDVNITGPCWQTSCQHTLSAGQLIFLHLLWNIFLLTRYFFVLTKYFSAAPIALPGGTTEISDIFDVLAGGEDEGTVRYSTVHYSTVHYSTIQYSAVQHYWFAGSCWGLTGRTPRWACCPGWTGSCRGPAWRWASAV